MQSLHPKWCTVHSVHSAYSTKAEFEGSAVLLCYCSGYCCSTRERYPWERLLRHFQALSTLGNRRTVLWAPSVWSVSWVPLSAAVSETLRCTSCSPSYTADSRCPSLTEQHLKLLSLWQMNMGLCLFVCMCVERSSLPPLLSEYHVSITERPSFR